MRILTERQAAAILKRGDPIIGVCVQNGWVFVPIRDAHNVRGVAAHTIEADGAIAQKIKSRQRYNA